MDDIQAVPQQDSSSLLYDQINRINSALEGKNWTGSWMSGGDNAAREAANILAKRGVSSLANLKTEKNYLEQQPAQNAYTLDGKPVKYDPESGQYLTWGMYGSGDSSGEGWVPISNELKPLFEPAKIVMAGGGGDSDPIPTIVPLGAEERQTYNPETNTFKTYVGNKLIDPSTGNVVATSNSYDPDNYVVDYYDTGNFFKAKDKTFGIRMTPDGVPIPYTSTEKSGFVYSPVLPILATMVGVPGLIGSGLAATGASALAQGTLLNTALSQGIMSGALSSMADGSFGKGFLSGAAAPLVGAGVGSLLPTGMDPTLAKAITQGASGGTRSAIAGGSFGKGFLGGAVSPLVSDYVGKALPTDMDPRLAKSITNTAAGVAGTAVRGGDPRQALLSGVLGGAMNYAAGKAGDAFNLSPQAIDLASGILAPTLMGRKIDPITLMSALARNATPYSRTRRVGN